jgi:adenosine deaminase
VPEAALLELARANAGARAFPDTSALRHKLLFSDFEAFIRAFVWTCAQLRGYDEFRFAAAALARELARQGVRYAEVSFSPGDFPELELARIACAIRAGLRDAGGPHVRLVVDLIRDLGPEAGLRRVEETLEVAREADVVAIGMGGREQSFPATAFAPAYRLAADQGLRRLVHAGETAGPESVRDALDVLAPDRIGHGTQAARDPALLARLARERVPLEVCLTSNLRTGAIDALEAHPLALLVEAGVPVTLSSDDPTLFESSLADEYERAQSLGLEESTLARIARAGFELALVDEPERAALLDEFDRAALATAAAAAGSSS